MVQACCTFLVFYLYFAGSKSWSQCIGPADHSRIWLNASVPLISRVKHCGHPEEQLEAVRRTCSDGNEQITAIPKKEQSVLLLTTQIPFENFKDSNDDPFWQWEDTPREFNSDGRTENCSCFECIAMVRTLAVIPAGKHT